MRLRAAITAHLDAGGAGLDPEVRDARALICPTGKSADLVSDLPVQPHLKKYFCFSEMQIRLSDLPSCPTEGRFAIVTDAGRDAVDADALLTNGAEADGEVVWS
jgi:hypothetical protein